MKNLLLSGLIGSMCLVSCTGVQNAATAQHNKKEFLNLKGEWEITSVDYDKSYAIKPFDEGADISCFVGSHWNLIPNNFSGAYSLVGGGSCPVVTQPIKFEVVNGNQFKFKKIQEGVKAKNTISGYTLTLVNQTENQFTLVQNVPFNGNNVRVSYNFIKTGK